MRRGGCGSFLLGILGLIFLVGFLHKNADALIIFGFLMTVFVIVTVALLSWGKKDRERKDVSDYTFQQPYMYQQPHQPPVPPTAYIPPPHETMPNLIDVREIRPSYHINVNMPSTPIHCPCCSAPVSLDMKNPSQYCAYCGSIIPEFQSVLFEIEKEDFAQQRQMDQVRKIHEFNMAQLEREREVRRYREG